MYHTGSFVKGQSLIYLIDPRIKLAAAICFSILILEVKPLVTFFIVIALFCVTSISSISLRTIWQALKPLLFFIVLIFVAHALFGEGETLIRIPYLRLSLSRTGLEEGFFVALRFLCLIAAAILLTMTTTPSQMIAAIRYLLRPLKPLHIPIDDIAVMIMLALRLMPVLLAEKERVEIAQKARGYHLRKASFIVHVRAFLSLTSTIMMGVFRRADELAIAMEARCYQGGERTAFVELKITPSDYLALAFLGVFAVILIALNSCSG